MAIGIRIELNEQLYLKDPQDTELGRKIISEGINLFDEVGFEALTFKKLAERIGSTEASIYRYFENKHLLLIYLVSWYWQWVRYLCEINTINITDPQDKLRIYINHFVYASQTNPAVAYVDEHVLHRVVIAESQKVYHTKLVDNENNHGFFLNYKELIEMVSEVIDELKPNTQYPRAIASTLFEMANNHIYYAEHLPRLTDARVEDENLEQIVEMVQYFARKLLAS